MRPRAFYAQSLREPPDNDTVSTIKVWMLSEQITERTAKLHKRWAYPNSVEGAAGKAPWIAYNFSFLFCLMYVLQLLFLRQPTLISFSLLSSIFETANEMNNLKDVPPSASYRSRRF